MNGGNTGLRSKGRKLEAGIKLRGSSFVTEVRMGHYHKRDNPYQLTLPFLWLASLVPRSSHACRRHNGCSQSPGEDNAEIHHHLEP